MTAPADEAQLFERLQESLAGTWSIERELGRGGMGTVYLARDVALDRPVALKVLHPALAADPEQRERFLREARTSARTLPISAASAKRSAGRRASARASSASKVAGELGSDAGEHRERAASVGHGPTGGTEGFDEAVTLTTELHEVCSLSPKRVLVKRLVVVVGGVDCGQATIGAGHRRRAMRRARPQRSTGTGPGGGWPGTRGGVVPIASTVDPRFGPGGPQGSGRLTSGNPQAAVDDGGQLL